jgi:hypothetical protein
VLARALYHSPSPGLGCCYTKRIVEKITVQEALIDLQWVCDIRGQLSIQVLREYLWLWNTLDGFLLVPGPRDP